MKPVGWNPATDPYAHGERVEPPNMPPVDLRPREICEKCAMLVVERQAIDTKDTVHIGKGQTIQVPAMERAAQMTLKVKGEKCWRCGDNSPRGTFPMAQPTNWSRFGEHGVYCYVYTSPIANVTMALDKAQFTALRDRMHTKRRNAA